MKVQAGKVYNWTVLLHQLIRITRLEAWLKYLPYLVQCFRKHQLKWINNFIR
jgi:hypothetical protein